MDRTPTTIPHTLDNIQSHLSPTFLLALVCCSLEYLQHIYATKPNQLEDSHRTRLLETHLEQWPTHVCPGEDDGTFLVKRAKLGVGVG